MVERERVEVEAGVGRGGWAEIALTPEIDTPEKRLSAVLNIVKNGAQTLTVLTMPADTGSWQSYYQINSNLNRQAGFRVVVVRTTLEHLTDCIQPIGVAARSSLDDKDWAPTEFGIKIKAALIFTWQRLLELNLDGMQVFASTSRGKRVEEGSLISTPALVRARILAFLQASFNPVRIVDLEKATRVRASAVVQHVQRLESAGLVSMESAHVGSGQSVVFFQITREARATSNWPVYEDKKGHRYPQTSDRVKEAVEALAAKGLPISAQLVHHFINGKYEKELKERFTETSRDVLSHFVRKGLLRKVQFEGGHFSEVSLTPRGLDVFEKILNPLFLWSYDPGAVKQINQIEQRLAVNPHEYSSLYRPIADSFRANSPNKKRDPEGKTDQILGLVDSRPGEYTSNSLGREMGIFGRNIGKLLKPLIESGRVKTQKAPKGTRRFLYPG